VHTQISPRGPFLAGTFLRTLFLPLLLQCDQLCKQLRSFDKVIHESISLLPSMLAPIPTSSCVFLPACNTSASCAACVVPPSHARTTVLSSFNSVLAGPSAGNHVVKPCVLSSFCNESLWGSSTEEITSSVVPGRVADPRCAAVCHFPSVCTLFRGFPHQDLGL